MKRKFLRKKKSAKQVGLYVNIDWEKAKVLFDRPMPEPTHHVSTKDILHIVAAAGTIGLALISPKGASVVGSYLFGDQTYSRWRTNKLLGQLAQEKYVSIQEKPDGSTTVVITKRGLRRALTYQLDAMSISKQKRWDKKWRVVIFDVPERYKKLRDAFRVRLRQLNLYQMQKSVYISPYPCFDEIEFLREIYGVAFSAKYLLVEKVEDDASLRKYFDLGST